MLDQRDEDFVSKLFEFGDRMAKRLRGSSAHTVAAGVRGASGRIYFGVNCDGIHGTCAELVAYANAVIAEDAKVDVLMSILIKGSGCGRIIPPCGNCRQNFHSLAPTSSVILNINGVIKKIPLAEMLPYPYNHF